MCIRDRAEHSGLCTVNSSSVIEAPRDFAVGAMAEHSGLCTVISSSVIEAPRDFAVGAMAEHSKLADSMAEPGLNIPRHQQLSDLITGMVRAAILATHHPLRAAHARVNNRGSRAQGLRRSSVRAFWYSQSTRLDPRDGMVSS